MHDMREFLVNDKSKRVFNGWTKLSEDERNELEKAMREYKSAPMDKRAQVRDEVTKMQTGPLGQGCPCCGR